MTPSNEFKTEIYAQDRNLDTCVELSETALNGYSLRVKENRRNMSSNYGEMGPLTSIPFLRHHFH